MADIAALKILKALLEQEAKTQLEMSTTYMPELTHEVNRTRMLANVVVAEAFEEIAKAL